MTGFFRQRYNRQGLWSLFLICAFPLHLWALLMAFRDISWVTERTNVWDAVGVVSYGLLFALIESLVVFLVMVVLGLFTPKQWNYDQRIGFLSLLILITSVWAIISQLVSIWNLSMPNVLARFLINSHHPVRLLYLLLLIVVTPTVLLPVYLLVRSKNAIAVTQNLMERFSTITIAYLIFDLIGISIVILRNVI